MNREERAAERLRRICLALPEASETRSWGHPNFKVGGKAFAVIEKYKGAWAIALKTEPERQAFLVENDSRFYVTPYVGKQGWVSMNIQPSVDWVQLKRMVLESYRLVAAAPAKPRPRRRVR